MAVVIPFIMAATGASAAIGAAIGISATAVGAIASITFAVTGINDKINKAASKVFGEDLVKIGNLFGTAYAAFNGGFDIGGGGEVATAGPMLSKQALDGTSAFGSTSVDNAFNLGDMAGAGVDLAGAEAAGIATQDVMSQADAMSSMGSYASELENVSGVTDAAGNVVERVTSSNPVTAAAETGKSQSLLPNTGAVSQQASAPQAAGSTPTGTGAGATGNVNAPPGGAATPNRNFFDKLLFNSKGEVSNGLLAGVGNGITSALTAKQKKDMFDAQLAEERRRQGQLTGIRVTR